MKTAGTCPGNKPGVQSEDGANWLISILPFLEQNGVVQVLRFHSL